MILRDGEEYLVSDDPTANGEPSKITNLDILKSIEMFFDYPQYFEVSYTDNHRWNAESTGELVSREDFINGTTKGPLSVFLLCDGLPKMPIITARKTAVQRRVFTKGELLKMVGSGSVILNQSFIEQIEKAKQEYLNGIKSLEAKTPSHPILKTAPRTEEDIDTGALLALQYWNIIFRRINLNTYNVYNRKMPFNFTSRITLVSSEANAQAKVALSEYGMLSLDNIDNFGQLPIDWIARILDKEPLLGEDTLWNAMPEVLKLQ